MYQQNQGFNQMNQYQQGNMNEMMMKQQNEKHHIQNLIMILERVFTFQNQPEFHQLIQLTQGQQKNISAQLDGCIKSGQIKKIDEATMATMRERCKKIKQKNQKILINVLNLREKLTRTMYTSVEKNIGKQTETIQLQQKIRKIRGQINSKFHSLKLNKKQGQKSVSVKKNNFTPVKTVMTQLRAGTQMLQKEVVKNKQEMKHVISYLHGN